MERAQKLLFDEIILEKKEIKLISSCIAHISKAISPLHDASSASSLQYAISGINNAFRESIKAHRIALRLTAIDHQLFAKEKKLQVLMGKRYSPILVSSVHTTRSTQSDNPVLTSIVTRLENTVTELEQRSNIEDEQRLHTLKGEARVHFHELHRILLDLEKYRATITKLLDTYRVEVDETQSFLDKVKQKLAR